MIKLEDLRPSAAVRSLLPDCLITVVNVQWFGSEALELTYKTPDGLRARNYDFAEFLSRAEAPG